MRKAVFTKFLDSLTQDELKEELNKLYTKYAEVKNFYTMELGTDSDRKNIFDKAKKKITTLYNRYRAKARVSKSKEILKGLESISIFDHELADAYLHHAESAVEHLVYYDRYRNADLNVIVFSFTKAVNLIAVSKTYVQFEDRLDKIIHSLHHIPFLQQELDKIYFELDHD